MSEESSTDVPGTAASDGEPVLPPTAAPKLRWLGWLRRTSLRVRIAAAAVAAAVIAASSIFVVVSSSPPQEYTSMPAPCDQVGLATLARYLPNPTGTQASEPAISSVKQGSCNWSGKADGEVRTLVSYVDIFGSPDAIGQARQFYDSALSALGGHYAGTSAGTRLVTGLGDKAAAGFVTDGPDADDISASGGPSPGVTLLVLSRNADITLNYSATATATGTTLPTDATKLTWLVSMAHGILADLAQPAAISAAPLSAEPHYADSSDPCRLIRAVTLARYAPGATMTPGVAPTGSANSSGARASTCSWSSGSVYIELDLDVFPDADLANQSYFDDVLTTSQTVSELTVTGARWLTDLGEEAAAIDETRPGGQGVEVFVWSGNVVLDYWYASTTSSSLDRATLLAGGIALARDGLAVLANPNASGYPQGPTYVQPDDACKLVKASTLARYAPGATVDRAEGAAGPLSCYWFTPAAIGPAEDDFLTVEVTIDDTVDDALGGFQSDVQFTRENGMGTTQSVQAVKGLGDQATVIFQIDKGDSPTATLCIWSGNAEVETSFSDLAPPLAPPMSRATLLAADVAMARDVLAALPR